MSSQTVQKCKECGIEKELSFFYSHPQWKNWVLWRCKECIKKWRKSERERIMARRWESENRVRPDWYNLKRCQEYRKNNPLHYKAHMMVNNYYRNKERPNLCRACWRKWKTELHHEDYHKPNKVYPLCSICHKRRHNNNLELNYLWEISLPF